MKNNQPISTFLNFNKGVEKIEETEHINLEKLWDDTSFMCRFEKNTDFEPIANIYLPPEFAGLLHKKDNILELIFFPLEKSEPFLTRKFSVSFGEKKYECHFDEPSQALQLLAKNFKEKDNQSDTNYRNLKVFRDFYRPEIRPKGAEKFFENKSPYSFFITGSFEDLDLVNFAKHLNFFMSYFDRVCPQIMIFQPKREQEVYKLPCYTNDNEFPETIQGRNIDPIIIDLLTIASDTSNIRLKYLFYYQILEYCSYYHLNEEIKRKLNNIIRRPDVHNNSGHFSRIIVEEFKNYFKSNDDKQKLEKLILDFIEYDDVKEEIKCNAKYYAQDIEFDGGFKIKALIKDEKEAETSSPDILKNLIDRIEKIRNVLVHIRESRENKVILPTPKNSHQLVPYLFLIRRVAENIA